MTVLHNQTSIPDPDSNPIRTVCFYTFNFQDALSHLRMIAPASHLGLKVIFGVEDGQVFVDRALLGDVIVLQRDFPRAIEDYEKILALARGHNIPVILDIDDLLFELPEDHPDYLKHAFTWTLLPTFQALFEVDLVTVTTGPLHDFVFDYNKNVTLLPNFLDDHVWQLIPPVRHTVGDEKARIGYMGGLTHQPDLDLIVPVIKNLIQRYPEKLEFHFWGAKPPDEFSPLSNVHWHTHINWKYPDFATEFQTQSIDIFIAPLVDNVFNNCKSSIKYLEYGSMGVPGIFSTVDPYKSVITHGVNGFLASTVDEWTDCLVQLIENPDLRYSMASNAISDIQSRWLLSRNASRWLSAFQQARALTSNRIPSNIPNLDMIRKISRQTVQWHAYTNNQLEEQKQQILQFQDTIANLEHQLAQRDATLTGITNSDTWKLALRLRRIREMIAPPGSRREKLLGSLLGVFSVTRNINIE